MWLILAFCIWYLIFGPLGLLFSYIGGWQDLILQLGLVVPYFTAVSNLIFFGLVGIFTYHLFTVSSDLQRWTNVVFYYYTAHLLIILLLNFFFPGYVPFKNFLFLSIFTFVVISLVYVLFTNHLKKIGKK